MRRRLRTFFAIFALFTAACLATGLLLVIDWHTPYQGYSGEVMMEVPKGTGAGRILDLLVEKGVARHRLSLKLAYTFKRRPTHIKAGLYRFDRPMTPLEALQKLLRGDVVLLKVTIPEGLRADETARLLSRAGLGKESTYLRLFADAGPILGLDPEAASLEGFLFPDSYLLDPGTQEAAVTNLLVRSFIKWWETGGGGPRGRDVHTTLVLASIVERESAGSAERPLVAGVFRNRIRIGMPLQTDPTVIYALVRDGLYRGTLTHDDLRHESPYNTYLHRGLPPGPICSPGRQSLAAALDPAPTDCLYFVSRNDGTHAFSRTLEEHNRAVAAYRRKVRSEGPRGGSLSRRVPQASSP